jgi:putative endonuclease
MFTITKYIRFRRFRRIGNTWLRRLYYRSVAKDRIGRWGERVAYKHLTAAGLIPVTTNWRSRAGEIDVVALDKRTLVIVEVKTRHRSLQDHYPAIAAVTLEKRKRLESLGRSFSRNHGPFCRRYGIKARRTDAIEVYYVRSRFGWLNVHSIHWHRGVGASTAGR